MRLKTRRSCLVICEKKTAIEVIYSNLNELGLGSLCAVIDDINRDRWQIIRSARSKIEDKGISRFSPHITI